MGGVDRHEGHLGPEDHCDPEDRRRQGEVRLAHHLGEHRNHLDDGDRHLDGRVPVHGRRGQEAAEWACPMRSSVGREVAESVCQTRSTAQRQATGALAPRDRRPWAAQGPPVLEAQSVRHEPGVLHREGAAQLQAQLLQAAAESGHWNRLRSRPALVEPEADLPGPAPMEPLAAQLQQQPLAALPGELQALQVQVPQVQASRQERGQLVEQTPAEPVASDGLAAGATREQIPAEAGCAAAAASWSKQPTPELLRL